MLFAIVIAVLALAIIGASFVVLRRDRDKAIDVDSLNSAAPAADSEPDADIARAVESTPAVAPKFSFSERLSNARSSLAGLLGSVFSGKVSAATWDSLEEALIRIDVGVATSTAIMESVKAQARAAGIQESSELAAIVKSEIISRLTGFDRSLDVATESGPAVWLFVGVNGVGKTTTIGKLACSETSAGRSVLLAAGDTFRAAAAEQLTMWAERSKVEIVRGADGADPSSVIFDAVEAANARGIELVLADTAGRLQNKTNLMEELRKVRRVAEKGAGTVTETLLVIDATTGQNGMSQAEQFAAAVDVTGVVLTKLDGSAKGGIVVAIHSELGVPVKLVGLGEGLHDLVEFDETEFVDALFE